MSQAEIEVPQDENYTEENTAGEGIEQPIESN